MTKELDKLPSLSPIWIVAFSGHRPSREEPGQSREQIESCRNTLRSTFDSLRQRAAEEDGTIELLCSAADGADLLAIQVADELGLPVHIVLPMPVESFARDFKLDDGGEPSPSWEIARGFIERACAPHSTWTFRIAVGDNARPGCYHDVNLQMLETADLLVAICKEELVGSTDTIERASLPLPKLGGTAEMIRMADVAHLAVPAIVLDPGKGGAIVRRDEWKMQGPAEDMFADLNSDMSSVKARQSRAEHQRSGEEDIWRVHQALDNVANNSSSRFRGSFARSIWLHFWATVLAAITAAFAEVFAEHLFVVPMVLTALELMLVVWATAMLWRTRRERANARWRRSRIGAELVDSQTHSAGLIDPLRPLVMKHDDKWKRFAIVVGLTSHRQKLAGIKDLDSESRFTELKQRYVRDRIENQVNYLAKQQRTATTRFHRCHTMAFAVSVVAIPAIAIALLLKILVHEAGKAWPTASLVFFLPIFLPLLAGLSSSLIVAGDAARRSSRYLQLKKRLERFKKLVPNIRTAAGMKKVVNEAEEILLDEIIEWHVAAENMQHMH